MNERYLYSSEAELPADEEGQLPLFILDGRIKGEGPCSIPNCGKPVTSRLLCNMHYMRLLRHGSPHHLEPKGRRRKINDGPCVVSDCATRAHAKGFCQKHYTRLRTHGDPAVVLRRGRLEQAQ